MSLDIDLLSVTTLIVLYRLAILNGKDRKDQSH